MSRPVHVAVDAMGGDHAPGSIVDGVVRAVNARSELMVTLVGDQAAIEAELKKYAWPSDRIMVRHASEVIEMTEPPVNAIRTKKDSSMCVGMRMVKEKEADAFASAGNSGAVLVGSLRIIGKIRGISRPPFASLMPTEKGMSLLLDSGANVDVRPEHMEEFAVLGSIYMEDVMGIKNPRVGLVNIGAEAEKGNALVKESWPLLENNPHLNFVGSVEARDIPVGGCDVLVADGFAGNIVLKMYEGTAIVLLRVIKKSLLSTLRSKIGALLIKKALKGMLTTYDASRYGGAPLLGLKALVVKMHGSSEAVEVMNAMFQSIDFVKADFSGKIQSYIDREAQDEDE